MSEERFVPREGMPIRLHAQLAGDPTGDSIGTYLAGKFNKASRAAEAAVAKPKEKQDNSTRRKQIDRAVDKAEGG